MVESGVKQARIFLGLEGNSLTYRVEFDVSGVNAKKLQADLDGKEIAARLDMIRGRLDTDFDKNNSLLVLKVPIV